MKVEPAGRTMEQEMGDKGRWLDMDQVKDTWEWQHRMLQKQLSNLVDDVPRERSRDWRWNGLWAGGMTWRII